MKGDVRCVCALAVIPVSSRHRLYRPTTEYLHSSQLIPVDYMGLFPYAYQMSLAGSGKFEIFI